MKNSDDSFFKELKNPQIKKLIKNYTKLSEHDKNLLVSISNQINELQ